MIDALFHLVSLIAVVLCIRALEKRPSYGSFAASLGALLGIGLGLSAGFAAGDLFGTMRFWGYLFFIYLPLFLFFGRRLLPRGSTGRTAAVAAAILLVAGGAYAYGWEPRWLEQETLTIRSAKIDHPIRIAVVADLQTDQIGQHERRALETVVAAEPDLILLTGDYLQARPERFSNLKKELRDLIRDVGFQAPLGTYAVRGDVDPHGWRNIFKGIGIETWEQTTTLDLSTMAPRHLRPGSVTLTGLSVEESRFGPERLPETEGLHIVFGHAPDFALADPQADLLIAGHTHGGQVRLPFIGPPVTFSKVPRSWSSGATDLGNGRTLIVSRGIGMERGSAPRLRFLCRPQVVIVDVVPVTPTAQTGTGASKF